MIVYIEAHGHQAEFGVHIPARQRIHFFALEREDAKASVTLKAQAEGALPASAGDDSELGQASEGKVTKEVRALTSYSGTTIYNYRLDLLESEERAYSEALRKGGLDVRYVGSDDLPSGMYLCEGHGKGECSPDKVMENDGHTCRGLLGKLASVDEIFMLSCRGAGSHDRLSNHPDLKEYFENVQSHLEYFWALTKSAPHEAWSYIQGLNERPQGTDKDPATAEAAQQAANNQELLIMMYNQDPGAREWIEAYDAILLWRDESPMAAYLQFLRVPEDSQRRWKKHAFVGEWITWMIETVEGHLGWLEECKKEGATETLENEWNGLSEIEKDQHTAVLRELGNNELLAALTRQPGAAETPSLDSVDWEGTIVDRIIEVLRNIRVDEHGWGYRYKDKLLIESDPQDAAMQWGHPSYRAMTLLDDHYDPEEDYAFVCKKQDDEEVILLMTEGTTDDSQFQTAIKRVNDKAEFTIKFVTEHN